MNESDGSSEWSRLARTVSQEIGKVYTSSVPSANSLSVQFGA